MGSGYAIELVREAHAYAELRALFREYQAHINVDLCFQDFETELASLEHIYASPHGAAYLARPRGGGAAVGCVALKAGAPGIGEMKRLYVQPAYQGAGLGRALVLTVLDRARQLGYARVRLDTLPSMKAAQQLYRSLGFGEIAPYYANPHPGTLYMERGL
jgi:ribosomal protein S18 acetylase RimI-like enzyme